MLLQMKEFHSLLWLDNIPQCICTTFPLSNSRAWLTTVEALGGLNMSPKFHVLET
jgi:hypothetical protein